MSQFKSVDTHGAGPPIQDSKPTPGPWFVCGARFRMNGGEWLSVNRYDESKKQDENIACVGYDPKTGLGTSYARLIAEAGTVHHETGLTPQQLRAQRDELLAALKWALSDIDDTVRYSRLDERGECKKLARAAISKVEGRS